MRAKKSEGAVRRSSPSRRESGSAARGKYEALVALIIILLVVGIIVAVAWTSA